jgi:ring-1,2-phenylacetyl-CoA epoxidase subunit PaaC
MTGSVYRSESLRDSDVLLEIADDELVIGWRDSEWTGIAPVLEEDVAFSSIAQNEIGHARAIYQLLAEDADALAFDRMPADYRCSPLVELRFVPDWARTIARRVLYEAADELRLARLKESSDAAVAGLAAKIDREEAYHRMHAEMWRERLRDEPRFREAVDELWPYAIAMADAADREVLARIFERDIPSNTVLLAIDRGSHTDDWPALWDEMTMVRRSAPGATW